MIKVAILDKKVTLGASDLEIGQTYQDEDGDVLLFTDKGAVYLTTANKGGDVELAFIPRIEYEAVDLEVTVHPSDTI